MQLTSVAAPKEYPVRSALDAARASPMGFEVARLESRLGAPSGRSRRQDDFQIVLVTRGYGVHVVDCDVLPVREGAVFLLTPASVHCWHIGAARSLDAPLALVHPPIAGFELNFDSAFVASCTSPETERVLLPALFAAGHVPAFYVDAEQLPALLQTFTDLEREYKQHELGRTSALQAHFQLLLVQLMRYRPMERPVCGPRHSDVLVRDFRSLVERHFRERLPLQHYAARLRVSEGHLCRIVRKQIGMTASDLMQERVVVEAKRFLVHLEVNIADIAASLGYDDPAYFARLFKKCTGQTPSEFRATFDGELRAQLAGGARPARARAGIMKIQGRTRSVLTSFPTLSP